MSVLADRWPFGVQIVDHERVAVMMRGCGFPLQKVRMVRRQVGMVVLRGIVLRGGPDPNGQQTANRGDRGEDACCQPLLSGLN